ncbi:hypothetical protein PTTG_00959 [Puccinia triticina 1-1 BBBD Race 1]|uniref:Uncharacterized protein n=1 Tax=Puccinia triticina (isolate 1-1 / race 1 (BBBD)) TaxID=630390 RepID=A0A180GVF2_PUCT1|nr:hypothetical protein PTTG_00959 [Puccinia triticina 1-1 BBBD Race 1]
MRAGAAEIRAANQCNSANSGYVVSAAPVPPMASAPPMGNPEYETNSVPEPLAWVPYAGITNVLDEIPPGENHMNEAGSQFSEEISDVDYSSLEHEARSVLLSDLDSNGEADGEEWEMDPGDLQAIIGVVLPSVQETPNHDLPEVPRSRKHRQVDKSWWPFRSKESHQVNVPTISGQATSLDHNSSIKGRYKGITWIGCPEINIYSQHTHLRIKSYADTCPGNFQPFNARGKDVYKLSQSWKWLEGLEQSARAPMVRAESGDFYLYEPLQLSNDDIVVPLYFYTAGGELWSKCVSPDFNPEINGSGLRLTIPGDTSFTSVQLLTIPVRDFYRDYKGIRGPDGLLLLDRCNGNLYGNQSKRWNKHISFFFTLSGLPPEMTNQQYNCHYLTTSNVAGAMELAVPIVADLRHLATEGVVGWDCSIMQEVLITSTMLCFLGDSPMHAEITSTPIPGNSLHPCRSCDLSAKSVKAKATIEYVASFCMLSLSGEWENCYDIWNISQKPQSKTAVGYLHTQLGVKDTLNKAIIDRKYGIIAKKEDATLEELKFLEDHKSLDAERQKAIFNAFFEIDGFDGCLDTPVEVLHVFLLGVVKYLVRAFMKALAPAHIPEVMARYQSFNTKALNIPSLQPRYLTRHYGNFIGKDFKVVLQTAPFVLFEYMTDHERLLWSSLCQLAPLIFETRIKDMETYLSELTLRIRSFVFLLIKGTAQWVNKPKFHMLLHLPDAIRRFGPATLFATEKFESYNGILRNASIHSNRQSPSKDIGVTFADFSNLWLLYSGGYFWVKEHQNYQTAATSVPHLFENNDSIQKAMGYNPSVLVDSSDFNPSVRDYKLPAAQRFVVPPSLASHLPGCSWQQVAEINQSSKSVVKVGSFVLYQSAVGTGRPDIGRVDMLWEARKPTGSWLFVCLTPFKFGRISGFYNMREVFQAGEGQFITVQHDCHKGNCSISLTKRLRVEREDTETRVGELTHRDNKNYVVNAAAISSALAHREFSDIPLQPIDPLSQVRCLYEGITQWHLAGTKTGPPMPMEVVDPSLV